MTRCLKSLCWLIRCQTFQFNNNWLNRINQSRIQCSECVKVRSSSWSTNICNGERSRRRANRTTPEAARRTQLCGIRNPKYYWFSLSTICGCWWRITGKIKTCSTFSISLCMLNVSRTVCWNWFKEETWILGTSCRGQWEHFSGCTVHHTVLFTARLWSNVSLFISDWLARLCQISTWFYKILRAQWSNFTSNHPPQLWTRVLQWDTAPNYSQRASQRFEWMGESWSLDYCSTFCGTKLKSISHFWTNSYRPANQNTPWDDAPWGFKHVFIGG